MTIAADHPLITFSYWVLRKISSPFIRFFLIKEVKGINNIPSSGAAIVALNHQSFFDFLCIVAVIPRNVHFLSAEKFFEHYWWRKLMFFTGQIKVNRESNSKEEVYKAVETHINSKKLIGIFPEGTRSPDKNDMLKAFTGVARFALEHHVPVIPIGIIGTYDVMAKHDTKPTLKKIVHINIGKPLYFNEYHDKYEDSHILIQVTEIVIKEIEMLSKKKYRHYESRSN